MYSKIKLQAMKMLSVSLLFLIYYHTQCQAVRLQGKLDIENGIASIFKELISQYLNDDTKNTNTDIDINKFVSSFQNQINKPEEVKHPSEVVKLAAVDSKERNRNQFKKSNVDSDDVKASKHITERKKKNSRQSTQGILAKMDRKQKKKNKNKTHTVKDTQAEDKTAKENDDKKIGEKDLTKQNTDNNMQNNDVRQQDEEKKVESRNVEKEEPNKNPEVVGKVYSDVQKDKEDKAVLREKTLLEEIIGSDRSVHLYGKHKGDKRGAPLNNIKV